MTSEVPRVVPRPRSGWTERAVLLSTSTSRDTVTAGPTPLPLAGHGPLAMPLITWQR